MAVNDIIKAMEAHLERVNKAVGFISKVTGEKFIKNARESVTKSIYERKRDRKPWELTGNLRNSIGYIVKSEEENIEAFGDGEGGSQGKKVANDNAPEKGIVMVAGMNYAAAVESHGYDVISNSANTAKADFEKLIKKHLSV
jgi:hypothetical protein